MGYNISDWKTKKLDQFTIPLAALCNHEKEDRRPTKAEVSGEEDQLMYLAWSATMWINGWLKDEKIVVHSMCIEGDWSMYIYEDVLRPAFKQSRGTLEAVLIWESGDSISRLTVKDGEVKSEPVEL